MPAREGNLETIWGRIREPLHAIGPEIVILPLLAVSNYRRAGRLELFDSVPNRLLIQWVQCRVYTASCRNCFNQLKGPGNTPDRLRWDCHECVRF
jgi:hypothetical protein